MDIEIVLKLICYCAIILAALILSVVSLVTAKRPFNLKTFFSTLNEAFCNLIGIAAPVVQEKLKEEKEKDKDKKEE